MQKEILLILTLYWRGLRIPLSEVWHLLEMSHNELDSFLSEKMPRLQKNWREMGLKEISWCEANNIHIVPCFHPFYIDDLKHIEFPPWLICVQGDLETLNLPAITVVGGRQLSMSAREWMDQHLSDFLNQSELNLVSGGARGTDQKAHQISIREGRSTWVHLPSGIANKYPKNLNSIEDEVIGSGGGFISAYAPFANMYKNHFHERNYNIASHGKYTFIVEARRRSGTLITARASLEYGKSVGVLPCGPNEIGLGGLDLIREGADIITNAMDLKHYCNQVFSTSRQ